MPAAREKPQGARNMSMVVRCGRWEMGGWRVQCEEVDASVLYESGVDTVTPHWLGRMFMTIW